MPPKIELGSWKDGIAFVTAIIQLIILLFLNERSEVTAIGWYFLLALITVVLCAFFWKRQRLTGVALVLAIAAFGGWLRYTKAPITIRVVVFHDADRDGHRDASEDVLPGLEVGFSDGFGRIYGEKSTDDEGAVTFTMPVDGHCSVMLSNVSVGFTAGKGLNEIQVGLPEKR